MTYRYHPPIEDMKFLLQAFSSATFKREDESEDTLVIHEMARFVQAELVPINMAGDRKGCRFEEGRVQLPEEIKRALKAYAEGGWMGLTLPEHWGGHALPNVLGGFTGEMLTCANQSISMFAALTQSASKALLAFASEELKTRYLPELVAGRWLGTMCLTEAQAGSDLGLIRTRATPKDCRAELPAYTLQGTKIFISAGEHNATDNILHLVLARIQGAPEGVKGISLFLVPKKLPHNELNAIRCIGIEDKMGIHANPTCTLSFEGATGYLVGEPNKGLRAMFAMMNEMRLGAALQGVGLSEQALQASLVYARTRKQGKTLKAAHSAGEAATPLISHPDIQRMLMTQKAFAEGGRALCFQCNQLLDDIRQERGPAAENERLLGLLTPIAKGFLTETGLESAKDAIQVFGGHGFIRDSGVEQIYRDGRIATLYEGTTGIQALDLLGRKVLGDQGVALRIMTKKIHVLCAHLMDQTDRSSEVRSMASALSTYAHRWVKLAQKIGIKALRDPTEIGAAATDFLHYSGYLCLGYWWLCMASTAEENSNQLTPAIPGSKLKTARFYFARLLPRADMHEQVLLSGAEALSPLMEAEWLR